MIRQRTPKPSPLVGEGAARHRRAAGEGILKTRARSLRRAMTDAEKKLWLALCDRRFAQYKFRRQVPVGPFIVDFVCYDARTIIEVDGGQHSGSESDRWRDQWLAANGFQILRFWNNGVLLNLHGVLTVVLNALGKATPHPARASRGHPSPARGEGKKAGR